MATCSTCKKYTGLSKKTNKFYWVSNWLRFYSLYFPGEQISLKQEHYTTKITQLLLSWTRRNTKFNRTDDKVNKYNLPRALVLTSSQTSSFIVCSLQFKRGRLVSSSWATFASAHKWSCQFLNMARSNGFIWIIHGFLTARVYAASQQGLFATHTIWDL